jgi:rare lipoprotein A
VQDSTLFSAAHRNLPLPSYVRVTNLDNGLETIVRVNDRGPFGSDRLIDLSRRRRAAGDGGRGEARVRLELITDQPDQMVEMVPMTPMTPMEPAAPAAIPSSTRRRPPLHRPRPRLLLPPRQPPPSPPKAGATQGKMIQVLASGRQARAEAMGKVMTQRYGVPYQVVAHGAVFRVLLGPVASDKQALCSSRSARVGWSRPSSCPDTRPDLAPGYDEVGTIHKIPSRSHLGL